jgi:hypothetical protein
MECSRRVKCVQPSWQGEFSGSSVSQESLWLRDGDSSGIEEGERPLLEAGTRGVEGQ